MHTRRTMVTLPEFPRLGADLDEARARLAALPAPPSALTFLDLLRANAARQPDKIAVSVLHSTAPGGPSTDMAYSTLLAEVLRAAALFRAMGARPDAPVLFLGAPTLEGLIAFWGAQVAGAVSPVNPLLSTEAIADIARASGACILFTAGPTVSEACWDRARGLQSMVFHAAQVVVDGGDDSRSFARLRSVTPPLDPATHTMSPGDFVAYFPTGGTTGAPKVARLTGRNLLVGALSGAAAHGCQPEHVVANGLPLFHIGGGIICTTRAILMGQTLVQLTPAGYRAPGLAETFWDIAAARGITDVIAVPTTHSDLLRTFAGSRHSIRAFVSGASRLPRTLSERCEALTGLPIHEGYGMTECSGFCTVNPIGVVPRAGSGGLVAPYYQVRAVQLTADRRIARDCAPGEVGTIVVSGPAVFAGYTDAALNAGKFLADAVDGSTWLDSGDLGQIDSDGFVWLAGRSKDLIIRGGHNLDPATIEDALCEHPEVAAAAAVGMPDVRVGELPVAFVELQPQKLVTEEELRQFCTGRIADRAAEPVRVQVIPALPRTAMLKIFKPELRRLAAETAVRASLDAVAWRGERPQVTVGLDATGTLHAVIQKVGDLDAESDARVRELLDQLGLAVRDV